ncbi:MAG: TetR/AcrR family transcriptional regulator [Anaerolineae bacterium]
MNRDLSRLDPRAKRTRALLRDTLLDLVVERGAYNNITIKDLTERAEVSRTTFYLHFKTVDDLLFETMSEIYQQIAEEMMLENAPLESVNGYEYDHVAAYADFYRVMLGPNGSASFVLRVRQFLAEANRQWLKDLLPAGETAQIPLELIGYHLAGAEIGVIQWWLEHDMPYTPSQMTHMMKHLCFRGLEWALHLPPQFTLSETD